MIVVLDASTLINLVNGEVLGKVLRIPTVHYLVSGVVRGESKSISAAIDVAVESGLLGLVDDELITIAEFRKAKREMKLDDGETECILAAKALGCAIGCDDGAARACAERTLGPGMLTGSIGLLRKAIEAGLMSYEEAFASFSLMKTRGGYLPELGLDDFKVGA